MKRAPRLVDEVQRLGVTVSVAALLIVLLVVVRLVWSVVAAPRDDRLRSGLLAVADSHQAMLERDAALRSFVATADPFFLQRADRTAPALDLANETLTRALEEPTLREDVLQLRLAQQRWSSEWAERARAPEPPGGTEAFLRRGTSLFDEYQSRKNATQDDVIAATTASDSANRVTQWGVGVLIGLIGVGTLALALRGRTRLQRHVVAPVDGLLAAVRGIGEGRLHPPEPVSGSAELVALRDGLADMTVSLRRRREEAAAQAERLQARARGRGGGPGTDRSRGATPTPARTARSPSRLVVGARVIEVLECYDAPEPSAGGEADDRRVEGQTLSAVEMLATLSGSAIEASRLHAATERLSQFDPLTQLANRRRMNTDMDSAVADAERHGHEMSVIMLDLDHFKELNDRYGHQQGDVVLQEVSSTIRSSMRDGESAYRYGGEEFAILVPHGGPEEAAQLAERLRSRIEVDFHRKGKQLVTASLGVAGLPAHAGDGEALVAEADRALYSAKNSGRNRMRRAGL